MVPPPPLSGSARAAAPARPRCLWGECVLRADGEGAGDGGGQGGVSPSSAAPPGGSAPPLWPCSAHSAGLSLRCPGSPSWDLRSARRQKGLRSPLTLAGGRAVGRGGAPWEGWGGAGREGRALNLSSGPAGTNRRRAGSSARVAGGGSSSSPAPSNPRHPGAAAFSAPSLWKLRLARASAGAGRRATAPTQHRQGRQSRGVAGRERGPETPGPAPPERPAGARRLPAHAGKKQSGRSQPPASQRFSQRSTWTESNPASRWKSFCTARFFLPQFPGQFASTGTGEDTNKKKKKKEGRNLFAELPTILFILLDLPKSVICFAVPRPEFFAYSSEELQFGNSLFHPTKNFSPGDWGFSSA
ncbi:PREDICTED: translation initiation factor IF-2-like, partial [Chinchilla lanigera]|uniref:translation initiation factor IF-2-like n=1 Tax=Chinchilla lanigera TaxID=34839 RepID=UPI0006980F41